MAKKSGENLGNFAEFSGLKIEFLFYRFFFLKFSNEFSQTNRALAKVARCRLIFFQPILSIFDDFSVRNTRKFPICLRQLQMKYNLQVKIARFARI